MTALVPVLVAVAVTQPPPVTVLYYPTKVGAKWTYKYPDADVTLVVTKVEDRDGQTVVSVGQVTGDGTVKRHQLVAVSGAEVSQLATMVVRVRQEAGKTVRLEDGWAEFPAPRRLLQLPLKPGEKWTQADGSTGTSHAPETVKVLAGEFRAVPVDYERGGKGTSRFRYWYAPGVGPVKWLTPKGDEIVLKEFTPGKD